MQPKILFIIACDTTMISHRLHLAEEAMARGYDVALLTKDTGFIGEIEAKNIKCIKWDMQRGQLNVIYQLRDWISLYRAIRAYQPSLIHAVGLKPVLYTLAANILQRKKIICALGGMGHTATIQTLKNRIIQSIVARMFAILYNKNLCRFIIQNRHDEDYIIHNYKIEPTGIKRLNGAGVDIDAFAYVDRGDRQEKSELLVGLASRMLWNKGIGHFVKAAQMLKKADVKCRFVLIGAPDEENPYTVPQAQLQHWHDESIIEWWGHRQDMADVLAQLDILCLPTFYGEGVPKVLIEGASTGLPLIAYQVAGCDVIIEDMQNGILVPPEDITGLAESIKTLASDRQLRINMGQRGREKVERDFTAQKINNETISLWQALLA